MKKNNHKIKRTLSILCAMVMLCTSISGVPGIWASDISFPEEDFTSEEPDNTSDLQDTDTSDNTAFNDGETATTYSENEEIWKQSVSGATLTGDYASDLVAVANTQLGVTENQTSALDGHYYSRYGEWYGEGNTYNEWSAMFISFCAHYANIPTDYLPKGQSVTQWAATLNTMYGITQEGYTPKAGDLIFFHTNKNAQENCQTQQGDPAHAGIVTGADDQYVYTIEGNSQASVQKQQYELTDIQIYGYLNMDAVKKAANPETDDTTTDTTTDIQISDGESTDTNIEDTQTPDEETTDTNTEDTQTPDEETTDTNIDENQTQDSDDIETDEDQIQDSVDTKQDEDQTQDTDDTKQDEDQTPDSDDTKQDEDQTPDTDDTKQDEDQTPDSDDTKQDEDQTQDSDDTKQDEDQTPDTDDTDSTHTIEVTDEKRSVKVKTETANLYTETSAESEVLATVPQDTALNLTGVSEDNLWYQVLYNKEETLDDGTTQTEQITAYISAQDVTLVYVEVIDNGELTVTAEAAPGVIPEGAQFGASVISQGTDKYDQVETKLNEQAEKDQYQIAGFLAYDFSFIDSEGNKIEPSDGTVKVSLAYTEAIIPETVRNQETTQTASEVDTAVNDTTENDTAENNTTENASDITAADIEQNTDEEITDDITTDTTQDITEEITDGTTTDTTSDQNITTPEVAVMHLVEDEAGNIQSVVNMTQEGTASVESDADGAVQKAEFETDSFSTFTITWKKTETFGTNLVLKYVDQDGNEIDANQDNVTITNTDEVKALGSYKKEISNYTYKEARLDSSDGTVVTHIRLKPLADGQSWTEERTPQVSSDYVETTQKGTWKDVTKSTVIYLVYETAATPTPVPSDLEVSHQKYIKKNDSGKYDLTLNVAGTVETETTQAKVDVLLIVDTSTSMTDIVYGKTRIQAVKDAVNGYTDSSSNHVNGLVENFTAKNIDAKYRLVTFGNYGNIETDWVDGSALTSAVNSLSIGTGVGTNYDQGLTKGKDALSSGTRSDATKIVIFLTDGQPTFYGSIGCTDGYNDSSTYPNGRGDSTNEPTLRAALDAAKGMSCDKFYAVGFNLPESIGAGNSHWIKGYAIMSEWEQVSGEAGRIYKERNQITNNYTGLLIDKQYNNSGYYNDTIWINDTLGNQTNKDISGEKLLGWVTSNINAEKKETCNLTTPEALQEKFSEIANSSTSFACSNVTITDQLSDYVQTTTDSALQIKVMQKATDNSGNVTYTEVNNVTGTAAGEEKNPPETTLTLSDGTKIKAKYDETSKTVTLDFPDEYTLKEDYCYYVTITNLEPTSKAYTEYKSSGYNAAGDKLTDTSGDGNYAISTGTSSEQSGFYSNTTATVTYTYKENTKKLNYAKPVIQVVSSDIVKSKTVKVADWDERTYNITLNVSSTATELSQANPVEVVLVFDKSGSMHFRSSVKAYKNCKLTELFKNDNDTGPYYYITSDYKATMYRVWRVNNNNTWYYYCLDDSYWNYNTSEKSGGTQYYIGWSKGSQSGNTYANEKILNIRDSYQFYTDDGIVNGKTYDRLYYLQKAANSFIDELAAMSPDSKVALVTFAATASKDVGLGELNSTQITSLKTAINNISTSSNTLQNEGLKAAKELLESDNNTDKWQRYVILLTDGCPNDPSGSVTEGQAYANVTTSVNALKGLTDKPTLMTIAVGLADNAKLLQAKNYLKNTVADADSKGNKYAYEADSASELTGIFKSILKAISQKTPVENADVIDYIDERFELTESEITRLQSDGAEVNTTTVNGKTVQYVKWSNQTIAAEGTDANGNTVPGWTRTFQVKAKDSFIGDNDVKTNGSGSGVIINGQLSEFEQPTVNVKAQLKIADKEVTIYKGDTVPTEESILNQIFAQTDTSYKNGTIGNDATIKQLIEKGRITIQWYTDEACTQSTTVEDMSKATPDSETKYYLKVTYKANNPTDESNANTTEGNKTYITGNDDDNGADDKTVTVTGVYTVKIISGAIDINKTVTDKDGETSNVTADTAFTFKVTKWQTDENGNQLVDSSFSKEGWSNGSTEVTITVKNGSSTGTLGEDVKAKLTNLPRGTYTVEEIDIPNEYATSGADVIVKSGDNGGTDCKYSTDTTKYIATFKLGYKNDTGSTDTDVITKTLNDSDQPTDYTYNETNGGVKGLVAYTNKLVTVDLDLKKVDAKTGGDGTEKYLSGAVFRLEKWNADATSAATSSSDDGTSVASTSSDDDSTSAADKSSSGDTAESQNSGAWETATKYGSSGEITVYNGDSKIELNGLQQGTYRLTEITAPVGYNILGDKIYFKVEGGTLVLTDKDGNELTDETQPTMWSLSSGNKLVLTIKNTEIYELPSAGGPGIYGFTISGVAFITAALLLFINNKRREDEVAG